MWPKSGLNQTPFGYREPLARCEHIRSPAASTFYKPLDTHAILANVLKRRGRSRNGRGNSLLGQCRMKAAKKEDG